jgi:hypothetical protein
VQALKTGLEIKKYTVDEQERTKRVLGLAQLNSAEAQTQLEEELGVIHKAVDIAHGTHMAASDKQHEAAMQQQSQDHAAAQSDADRQQAQELAAQSAEKGESE